MIITKTPLRITFVGGTSDKEQFYTQHGGAAINGAIDQYVYVLVNDRRMDDELRARYTRNEFVKHVDELKNPIYRAALGFFGISKGIEVISASDLPRPALNGSGLGSSSTLAVGLANALYYRGYGPGPCDDPEILARTAVDIERIEAGEEGGKQDQYAAAYGGVHLYQFNKDRSVVVHSNRAHEEEMLMELRRNLMLFHTGRGRHPRGNKPVQGPQAVLPPEEVVKRKLEMRDMAFALFGEWSEGVFENTGRYLDRNWRLKREVESGMTDPVTDALYEMGKKAGAEGGKAIGNGGGAYMLYWIRPRHQQALRERLLRRAGMKEIDFQFERRGSHIWSADHQKLAQGLPLPAIRSY